MEDNKTERYSPPPFKLKFIKILTLTLFFLAVFFAITYTGVETTSSSSFCSSCHEMKPEFYTWKASTHSEVDCVSCHIQPGAKNYAKAKANGLKELYKKQTQTYTAPIQMPKEIPNSACERCHNMDTRNVTPTGDLIIPHDKHAEKDVACIQCHSGVAHGKIAERKVTFQSDYGKWDQELGKAMMKDPKFSRPQMDKCMECHKARKVTTECQACHTTGMYPDSHKKKDFKLQTHGGYAKENTKACNSCHKYMSSEDIDLFKNQPAYTQYLRDKHVQDKKVSAQDYAKENSFCKDCHTQRPESHSKGFIKTHGSIADKNEQKCLTCHDFQKTGKNKTSNVTCASCHPSSHDRKEWRRTHPINVPQGRKVNETCYACHFKPKCSACHRED